MNEKTFKYTWSDETGDEGFISVSHDEDGPTLTLCVIDGGNGARHSLSAKEAMGIALALKMAAEGTGHVFETHVEWEAQ